MIKSKQLDDPADRKRIIDALYAGINDPNASQAWCFMPHHGIYAEKGKRKLYVIICFRCGTVGAGSDKPVGETAISNAPQPIFDSILK